MAIIFHGGIISFIYLLMHLMLMASVGLSHLVITGFHSILFSSPILFIPSGWVLQLWCLLILKKEHVKRLFWVEFGLGISTLYFMYCIINKIKTDTDIRDMLQQQHIIYNKYFTTPTPLNNWLWCVTAGNDTGFYIGYYSVFDREKKIELHYFPQNDSLLNPVRQFEDVQHLLRFSKRFYTVEKWSDTLVFNDLRFEQMVGWYNRDAKFVFHYFLQHPYGNKFGSAAWPLRRLEFGNNQIIDKKNKR
jgi:inner membrane protein